MKDDSFRVRCQAFWDARPGQDMIMSCSQEAEHFYDARDRADTDFNSPVWAFCGMHRFRHGAHSPKEIPREEATILLVMGG